MLDRVTATDATLLNVGPRALKRYAKALGWNEVGAFGSGITAFSHPSHSTKQLLLPNVTDFDDYADVVRTAIQRLADFEQRSASEVLNHLLLPPADLLRFSEKSVDAEGGSLTLPHAISVLEGVYKMILAQAHSELSPKRVHLRMSRSEAESFTRQCRLGQTERGSFTLTVACPLPSPSGMLLIPDAMFSRRVTLGVVESLGAIARVADGGSFEDLSEESKYPMLSANFCEALLMLRPDSGSSLDYFMFDVSWSRAFPPPIRYDRSSIRLDNECFDVAEHLAESFRLSPDSESGMFIGFVHAMKGQADESGRVSGEVVFRLLQQDDPTSLLAKADLDAADYQIAGAAHLDGRAVACNAILLRGTRFSRLTEISDLAIINRP